MRKVHFSGIQQAMTPIWLMSVLGMGALVFVGSTENLIRAIEQGGLLPAEYHKSFLKTAFQSDAVVSFIPVLAVLPFSGSYVDEIKSKFARLYLIRSDYHSYLLSRIVVCFLCGGSVIFLGGLLSWGTSTLLFLPMEKSMEQSMSSMVQLWPVLGLFFLTGGLWSVVGMAMSTLMESKYISYATPFVFYYLLVILYERYLSDLFIIYPKTWTDPAAWPFGCWGAAIFLLEMTLIFAILFAYRAGRRLQQL